MKERAITHFFSVLLSLMRNAMAFTFAGNSVTHRKIERSVVNQG